MSQCACHYRCNYLPKIAHSTCILFWKTMTPSWNCLVAFLDASISLGDQWFVVLLMWIRRSQRHLLLFLKSWVSQAAGSFLISIWELLKSTQNSHPAPFYGNKTHRKNVNFVTSLLISHKLCRAYSPIIFLFSGSVLKMCDLRKKKHFRRLAQINGRGEVISVTAPTSSWSTWQLQQQDGLPEIRQHAFLFFLALKGRTGGNCSPSPEESHFRDF